MKEDQEEGTNPVTVLSHTTLQASLCSLEWLSVRGNDNSSYTFNYKSKIFHKVYRCCKVYYKDRDLPL